MRCKKACLVVNPRDGQNLAKISDIMAVFAAAGWGTDVGVKMYPGHTMELATEAAKEDCDLIIAYGGDGTVNQVVNGAMNSKKSVVGIIPGGTANVWANEINIPSDPVKAALALTNSDVRQIDVGHIEVEGLTFPSATQDEQQPEKKKKSKKIVRGSAKTKHHFLLVAGFGFDAAVVGGVNRMLKHRIGVAAFALSTARGLATQEPFPVEIQILSSDPTAAKTWHGKALQVIVCNSRRYGGVADLTPDAMIDDGILDILVITEGNTLSTLQQLTTLLLQRKADAQTAEYFQGAHLSISIPASVGFHLDGTAVKLKDYLSESERATLEKEEDAEHVMVHYRLDALPQALHTAIPRTYSNTLFEADPPAAQSEEAAQSEPGEATSPSQAASDTSEHNGHQPEVAKAALPELIKAILEDGRKVIVVGAALDSGKQDTYIVAGRITKARNDDTQPVAVRIDEHTILINATGEHVPASTVQQLQTGQVIVVEGKKSKHCVIQATRAVIEAS